MIIDVNIRAKVQNVITGVSFKTQNIKGKIYDIQFIYFTS